VTQQHDQYIGGDPAIYEAGGAVPMEPVPVVDMSERRTPETVSCMTWNIPQVGVGQPVQILQRRIHRFKAKVTISGNTGATAVVFSPKLDTVQGANPQGATYAPPAAGLNQFLPDWESQKPLYVIAIGGSATVTVQDEAYSG
jgi:hypothetical protein